MRQLHDRLTPYVVCGPTDFILHLLSKMIEGIFVDTDTIPDTRKVILKVGDRGTNLPNLHFSGFPSMVLYYGFSNPAEIFQNSYPI